MSAPSSPPGPPELSDGARISYGHAATYGEEIEPRLAEMLAERSEIAPDASMMPTSSSDDAATVLAGSVSGGTRHTTSGKVSKNVTEAEGKGVAGLRQTTRDLLLYVWDGLHDCFSG